MLQFYSILLLVPESVSKSIQDVITSCAKTCFDVLCRGKLSIEWDSSLEINILIYQYTVHVVDSFMICHHFCFSTPVNELVQT